MPNTINVHATCVVLAHAGGTFGASRDAGVLLLGKSGSGKSDLALRLISRGAILVSDDRTELSEQGGHLVAKPPANLRGLIEARGVGIVALPHAHKARVALAVQLDQKVPRLPREEHYKAPWDLPVPVPLLRLAAFESSAPEKIALAVAAFERNLFRDGAQSK
ncbi:MAG: HPr kinase/phosphatase C-terminal domain-containing protein [Alphaproteobacteria bacterium]|nr:HPr kinase/phosphatase C-terminal domain-containing protein [Alphaproteobacteria bacterium]